VAYEIGHAVLGGAANFSAPPAMNGDLLGWIPALIHWVISLGKPLALGIVLLACLLSVAGYAVTRLGWRYWLMHALRKRANTRKTR
jgi:hypothetical protein